MFFIIIETHYHYVYHHYAYHHQATPSPSNTSAQKNSFHHYYLICTIACMRRPPQMLVRLLPIAPPCHAKALWRGHSGVDLMLRCTSRKYLTAYAFQCPWPTLHQSSLVLIEGYLRISGPYVALPYVMAFVRSRHIGNVRIPMEVPSHYGFKKSILSAFKLMLGDLRGKGS